MHSATLETLRLKEESRLMEERLAMLKNLMKAEKASRRYVQPNNIPRYDFCREQSRE